MVIVSFWAVLFNINNRVKESIIDSKLWSRHKYVMNSKKVFHLSSDIHVHEKVDVRGDDLMLMLECINNKNDCNIKPKGVGHF